MKKYRKLFLLLGVLLLTVIVALVVRSCKGNGKEPYKTAKISRGDINTTVEATGTLNAVTTVEVGSQVSGIIQKVFVDFNSPVRMGQALAQLDPSTFKARVEEAQANLQDAQASLAAAQANASAATSSADESRAGLIRAEQAVLNAQAALEEAQASAVSAKAHLGQTDAELTQAEDNDRRSAELYRKEFISQSDRQDAQTKLLVARAADQAARSDLNRAQAGVKVARSNLESAKASRSAALSALDAAHSKARAAQAQVNSAQAGVSRSRAALESAQVDLSRSTIRSPINGVVISRHMDVGQTVAASFQAPKIFTLAESLSHMQVEATIDEADIGQLKEGQDATFNVDAYPEKTFTGKVAQVRMEPVTVQNVVTYTIIIKLPNPGNLLRPGMTAEVNVCVGSRSDALRLPNAALRYRPTIPQGEEGAAEAPAASDTDRIWVPGAGNHPRPVDVKVGISNGQYSEILAGALKEGDPVIIGTNGAGPTNGQSRRPRRMGPMF